MNEYLVIMSINGALMLLGIAYVFLIFRKLNRYVTRSKAVAVGPIFGGFLVAIGFLGSMQIFTGSVRTILLILLLTGPAVIMYPLGRLEMLLPTRRFLLQFFLILLTLFLLPRFHDPSGELFHTGTLLIFLIFVYSLLMLRILSPFLRYSLLVSSWLIVVYSWLRVFMNTSPVDQVSAFVLLLYSSAIVLWLYSAMGIYDYLRRWL